MLGIFPLHQIFANIKSVSRLVLLFVRQCEIGTLLFTWTLPAFPPLWLTNDLYGDTLKPCEYSCTHFSAQKSSANAYLLIKKARQERSLRNPNDKVGPYVMPCNKVDRAQAAPVSAAPGFTDWARGVLGQDLPQLMSCTMWPTEHWPLCPMF